MLIANLLLLKYIFLMGSPDYSGEISPLEKKALQLWRDKHGLSGDTASTKAYPRDALNFLNSFRRHDQATRFRGLVHQALGQAKEIAWGTHESRMMTSALGITLIGMAAAEICNKVLPPKRS